MADLSGMRREAFGRAQRAQHFAANYAGMNPAERHKKFVNDYLTYYGRGDAAAQQQPVTVTKTDLDALKEEHRFIRTADDDADERWEARLAKKYYDRLFKEYCIGDLSRYKESKLGLRWRTQKEVVCGKGQFICGAKGCEATEGLCSYEVNFNYVEGGEHKQALIKLRVCPSCAFKLNYRKEKQLAKAADSRKRKRRESEGEGEPPLPKDPLVREALDFVQRYTEQKEMEERAARDVAPPPGVAAGGGGGSGGGGGGGASGSGVAAGAGGAAGAAEAPAIITMPADNSVWEAKPQQESATVEDEFEQYFEDMFL